MRNILLARIGWMKYYNGPIPGDERPLSGGRYNIENVGGEVDNFLNNNGYYYGYVQPSMASDEPHINISRIGDAKGNDEISNVLVIFVAKMEDYGQVVVGWYKDATVFNETRNIKTKYDHGYYNIKAKIENGVLLPTAFRNYRVKTGKNSIGRSNVWYPRDFNGDVRNNVWFDKLLRYIDEYNGPNIANDKNAEIEESEELAGTVASALDEGGAGFQRNMRIRRVIELYAMKKALSYFNKMGYSCDDVSGKSSYDIRIKKDGKEICVEVKGMQGEPEQVMFTPNEVALLTKEYPNTILFIVHSIKLMKRGRGFIAKAGTIQVNKNFKLLKANLKSIGYCYKLCNN